MSFGEFSSLESAVVPVAAELCAIGSTLSMYDLYSSCLLWPWHEPTQKTRPTTTAMASATRPASRARATAPGGGGAGRRGPPPRFGLIRRRGLPGASSVAGSSKNSRSVSSSS